MVVSSGAQIGMLGNYAMLFDCDFLDAIERHIVANPTVVADYDLPRKGYVNARSNQNLVTYFCSEEAPSEPSPRIKRLRHGSYQQGVEKPPKLDKPSRPSPELVRRLETRKILELIALQIVPTTVLLIDFFL